MWTDVIDLRDFYATSLGQAVSRMLRRRLREIWPDVQGQRVLGVGYAVPYLRPFMDEAERVIAAMPPAQGVLPWPAASGNVALLADEAELPLPDLSMDRVLLVHAVEQTEQLRQMLREAWRVLAAGGRMIVVVPNRRGLWAQLDRTPFGQGLPYSATQLSRLLRDSLFTPIVTTGALFVPPSQSRMMIASAPAWEKLGLRWFPSLAGVVMIEAVKQIYAPTAIAEPAKARRKSRVLAPLSDGGQRREAISAERRPDAR
ncbi:MAG TPA: methyltransferase domain-containing protein [Alphaproteobacteria bacterium]|nr:methyltransferase domain-containing protein [Alphaproteobacteria bacterium]